MSRSAVRELRRLTDPEASDDELVLATRAGDSTAFGVLWDRHSPAALRAARSITNSIDPEDLVSEAFAKTFSAIRNGGGPTDAFRPYIFAAVRSAAATWGGKQKDVVALEYIDELPVEHTDDSLDLLSDRALLTSAFKDLPERWRTLLWYLEVEGMKPREIAPLMGMTPNAVSVLAARAREGFKIAWLQAHIKEPGRDAECRWVCERIVAQGRKRHVARADRARFDAHLERCPRCTLASAEVEQASSKLRAVLLPVIIGGPAAAAYSAGSPAPAMAASASGLMPGGSPRWLVVGGTVAAATAAIAVAAVAAQLAPVGSPDADESSALVVTSPAPIASPGSAEPPVLTDPPRESESPVEPQPPTSVPEAQPDPEGVDDPIVVPRAPTDIAEPSAPGDARTQPAVHPPSAPAQQPSVEQTPNEVPPGEEPPGEVPPDEEPPGEMPPDEEPPVDEPVTLTWDVLPDTTVPPMITGTGTPGAAVEIVDETGRVIATTAVDADGTFTVRLDFESVHQGISISMRHTSPTGEQTVSEPTGRVYFAVPGLAEDSDGVISRTDSDDDGRNDDLSLDVRGVAGSTVSVSLDGNPASTVLLTGPSAIVSFLDTRPGIHRITLRYVDPATGALGFAETDHILVVP